MRVKVRVFSGVVCEQYVYTVSDRIKEPARAKLRPRFADEAAKQKHKDEIARRRFVNTFNETFAAFPVEDTVVAVLTFDDAHEVDNFPDAKTQCRKFLRRIRYGYPDSVAVAVLGRGKKNSRRIHIHLVTAGIPAEVVKEKWDCGLITEMENLRKHNYYRVGRGKTEDRGRDYTNLANYMFNHWTPEQGGHRYMTSGKLKRPEKEAPTACKRTYNEEKAPAAPKGYKLVESRSTPYGYLYYKYVRIPERDDRMDKRRADAMYNAYCRRDDCA